MTTPDRNQDLLTGPPGCGKTPVIRRLIERLGDHVRSRSRHRVGRYGVEPEQLAPLVQEELAGAGEVDVYLVDEVGKMEMLCPAFVEAVPVLLGGATPVGLTVAQKGQG